MLGTDPVTDAGVQPGSAYPASVAVHHQADVGRQRAASYVAPQPLEPGTVQDAHYLRPSPWNRACIRDGVYFATTLIAL